MCAVYRLANVITFYITITPKNNQTREIQNFKCYDTHESNGHKTHKQFTLQ